jgi:hypothetical protein
MRRIGVFMGVADDDTAGQARVKALQRSEPAQFGKRALPTNAHFACCDDEIRVTRLDCGSI